MEDTSVVDTHAPQDAARCAELERALAERTQELAVAQDRLAQLERHSANGVMARGFAHEMRNSLTGASYMLASAAMDESELGGLRLQLRHRVAALQGPEATEVAAAVQLLAREQAAVRGVIDFTTGCVDRCLMLVQRILDYAEADRGLRANDAVSLAALVQSISDDMGSQLQGVELRVEVPASLVLSLKRRHAYTIVHTLLSNASDAVRDQPVDPRRIVVEALPAAAGCVLRVTDSGVGIDPGEQGRIFEPFYSTKGVHGAGLGLALSKKLAELYGGHMEFTSHERGTCFSVTLPAG